jgi:tRNA threonylcarbamoyladenosine biosynthesis protein TsaE
LSGPLRLESDSPQRTEAIGAELASELGPGDLVLVSGELGSGKTTLVRGACRALGVREPVVSPTFTLGARYRGRFEISHLDLHRLEDLDAEVPGLVDEYLATDTVAFVEWPAVAADDLEATLRVAIERRRPATDHRRRSPARDVG